ncbi:hypothetical protein [uncultured Microscilla sp.]|uniref:hypothetical protein n=1 Tax=uncultured Microscilla sp. TaxID=432653 RepID=UPI00261CC38F|nr:hypothetical protein [uncultured Microscilla sp.]
MTTLKGVVRSYGAAVRRMEREQQRQAREAAKRFKEQQKQEAIADAKQAVEDWKNYINMLQSVHKNCTDHINWDEIKNIPKPIEPNKITNNEDSVQYKLDKYKPSFLDKILGSSQKKVGKLESLLEKAKQTDIQEYNTVFEQYTQELDGWNTLQKMAQGVDDKNPEAYKDTLEYFDPFSDIGELGGHLSFSFESSYVDIDLHINCKEIIPDYELKQTSTGKLSRKNMAKSKFNELYQDHICSAIIRVARETFAYLPVEYVRVNAMTKLLNSKTGHLKDEAILSVIMPPETIDSLNLETIDPSDSMQNFVHNMKFKKTNGFGAVEKVELNK